MEDIAARIDRHVDRSGAHHLWTGATWVDGLAVVKVDGRVVTAGRVVWELAHGPLGDGARVLACPDERACVRLDHLRLDRDPSAAGRKGARWAQYGSGSKRRIRPGVWKLAVRAGRFDDGTPRRLYRTVRADSATEAGRLLADFVAEVRRDAPPTTSRELRDLTVDAAVGLYLDHLLEEKGRGEKTVGDYRRLHDAWFAEAIGRRRMRDVDVAMLDAAFGRMQRAGRSRSTMHHAEALYGGLFRWAKARGIVGRNSMADFELPTSSYVPRERPPAEAEEMALLLGTAAEHAPEILALLVLGATSGKRRGELVALRRSSVDWDRRLLRVEVAADAKGQVKATKTRRQRTFRIDEETVAVLRRHCEEMDERAALFGTTVASDGFVFSLEADCSNPMPPDWVTKRVAVLKEHLGVADKRPETIALEDEALRLFRGDGPTGGQDGPAAEGRSDVRGDRSPAGPQRAVGSCGGRLRRAP